MKRLNKLTILIIVVCVVFGLAACGKKETPSDGDKKVQQQDKADISEAQQDTDKSANNAEVKAAGDVLVVYFSATGTTKGVAEKISAITNADIYEIIPSEPYSDKDLNYNDEKSRSSIEMNDTSSRPEIGSETISLEGISTIYVGYPIWWGDAPRIMSTFVESYDFDGITMIPFCTSGGSGIGDSGSHLKEQAGSGNWLAGQRFDGGVSEKELRSFIDGL